MKRVALSFSAAASVLSVLFVGTPAAAFTGSGYSFPNYSITDFLNDAVSVFSELAGLRPETWTGFGKFLLESTFIGGAPFTSISNIYFIICIAFILILVLAAIISAKVYAKKEGS